jgi:exosortase
MTSRATLALRAAAAVVLLIAYVPFGATIVRISAGDFYARHVVFVPVFAMTVLWIERHRLRGLAGGGGPGGPAIAAAALALLGFGYATASVLAQTLSFVGVLTGLVVWFYGVEGARRSAFVLAFLLLMIPPPREAIAAIAPGIQHAVAAFSAVVAGALQIPIEQQGIFLRLPGLTLVVAEACAGLRFSLILFVFVVAFARLVLPSRSTQVALILLSIPVVMMANAMRVTAITVGAYVFGTHVATGSLHDYIGKSFWILAVLTMITFAMQLRTRTIRNGAAVPAVAAHPWRPIPGGPR